MKLCNRHFHDLKTALQHKGLWYLVDLSDPVLARKMEQWRTRQTTDEDFCPYVGASLEIYDKANTIMGPEYTWIAFGYGTTGKPCPLCAINQHQDNQAVASSWIDNVTDMMVLVAQVNNIPTKRVLS